jgi:hypothetical protein
LEFVQSKVLIRRQLVVFICLKFIGARKARCVKSTVCINDGAIRPLALEKKHHLPDISSYHLPRLDFVQHYSSE